MSGMPLRRRRPFAQGGIIEVTARASIVGHMERSPEDDYCKVEGSTTTKGTSWVGEYRNRSYRQLAVIQTVAGEAFSDFRFLAKIAHPNIARILALYHYDNTVYVAYECVPLDLFDICPLSEPEIAEVMSQLLSGVRKLMDSSVGFRIDSVRVTPSGSVKIVLDWSYEIVIDSNIQKTLREYTARDLYEIMQKLGSIKNICSSNAKYFLEMLGQKTLPETTDPFLSVTRSLREAAQYATQKKLAIS